MTPEHSPNPFNNPEFRKEMSEMFDDKVSGLADTQREHSKRITSLERWRWVIVGGGTIIVFLAEIWASVRH